MSYNGFIFLHKPSGITSFQSLGSLKRIFNTKKIGHTGTLDKFASGAMIVCVGSFTRLASYITQQDKEYKALIRFGIQTDTLDPEGDVVATGPIPSYEEILSVIDNFKGVQFQVPPKYSAVHIDGKRAYKKVRSGEEFDMPARKIEIYDIEPLTYKDGIFEARIACSKGTYIRSLARDIAQAVGTVGSLAALQRTRVGGITDDMCSSTEQIMNSPNYCLKTGVESVNSLLNLPSLVIDGKNIDEFSNGQKISEEWFKNCQVLHAYGAFIVLSESGEIEGIIVREEKGYRYQCVIHNR